MSTPVTIENDALRLEVWPAIGGKVASVVDKADEYDLLFNYPAELPTGPRYDQPYGRSWFAGWDECFPTIAASKYVGHPYDGVPVPDHGELWGIPTTAVPTKDGITCVWHGLRFGYRLTRKLYLEDASLHAEYSLVNLAPFEMRFVWSAHALLSMDEPVELSLDAPLSFRLSHDADGNDLNRPIEWPIVDGHDLSRPTELPARKAWKVFANEHVSGPARARYPSRGRSLKLEFASADVSAYWGVWVNTGGWCAQRHFALEPTMGRFNPLERAIRDGSAGKVAPSGRCDWSLTWTVEADE